MSTKRFLKWIAGFMSVIMLVTILPMQAIAQQVHALETASSIMLSEEEILATLPQEEGQPMIAPILEEVEEKRDAFTKHFMTSEHTFIAATYPYAVHYEEDGTWQEIDNTLQLKTDSEQGD